jgi:hypothetical protein
MPLTFADSSGVPELVERAAKPVRKDPELRRIAEREALAEIGRSYNVSHSTISRL